MKYRFYTKSEKAWLAMLEDIKSAKESIYLESFILKDDNLTHSFFEILKSKAAEGVRIRIVVDKTGNFWWGSLDKAGLEKSGAELLFFNRWIHHTHRKILIIDDEANIRKLIAVNLIARGYEVIEAEDGQEGLALLRDAAPAILLLDIKLPDMSGWEILKTMKDNPLYRPIPVIVITASLGITDYELYKNENLRKILKKPISIQELTEEVKEALN